MTVQRWAGEETRCGGVVHLQKASRATKVAAGSFRATRAVARCSWPAGKPAAAGQTTARGGGALFQWAEVEEELWVD